MTRIHVLKGIGATKLPVAPTEDQLAEIVRKVEAANPGDLEAFAFVAGRNWAVSAARRADAERRRLTAEAERSVREAEETRAFEAAKSEARELVARLNARVKPTQRDQLRLVWWKVFEGKSADACAALLPGTNADCRVKRFQRGRSLLLAHASPELRAFLSRRVSPSGGVTETPLPASSG